MIHIIRNSIIKGNVTMPAPAPELETLGAELKELVRRQFGRSFHIREVDTGSCGACESELLAAFNPLYDAQRFGIDVVASPRHADALLVAGPVSKNMETALRRTFDAMPAPRFVITLGDCALDGGRFKDSYYTVKGVKNVLPVTFSIPGCPPKPVDILRHLLAFLKSRP